MVYSFGVDLGTTFSAAAIHRDGQTSIFPLGTDRPEIPSVLLLRDDGTILTGDAAARRASAEPERVVREFKRRLGDPTPIIIAGSPYSAEALTARLLGSIIATVVSREGPDYERIAITHPANWGNFKLDLLKQAVQLAGVNPNKVQLLSEPQAAAISYASNQRVAAGETIAVYDLGGGTFDAAVVRRTAAGFDLVGRPEGIERLGGIDFDAALYAHVGRSLAAEFQNLDPQDPGVVAAVSRLKADCVEAKEALSSDSDTTITVSLPQHHGQIRLTRAEFESIVRPPLLESVAALERAVQASGLELSDIDRILLAGGSSRIPLVGELVAAELGRPTAVDAHPKHAVALGAALAAGGAQALPSAVPGATGIIGAVAAPTATPGPTPSPIGIREPNRPAPTGSVPNTPTPVAGAFDPAATIVNPGLAATSASPPAVSPPPPPAAAAAATDVGPSNPLHAFPPPSGRANTGSPSAGTANAGTPHAGTPTAGPSNPGPATTRQGGSPSFDPDATAHLPTAGSGIVNASPQGPSVLLADSGVQQATTGFGTGPTPVSGPARWESAARPPTSLRARRNLLAALVVFALLVGGGATWALTRDSGPSTGSAASSAVVDMDGDGDIDEDDDAIVAAEQELESASAADQDDEQDDTSTDSDEAENEVDPTDDQDREDSERSTTSTSTTEATTTTSLQVTTTTEETTTSESSTTSSSTTSSTTTTSTTTTPPSGDLPIEIVSGPSVSDVTATSFRFAYTTNDVCGDGVFTVRNKANNAVAGTWNGTGGCSGPGHGGSPGAPGPFSGFNLDPATTYVVSITVNGTPASGGRSGGTGSASTSLEVTTSG